MKGNENVYFACRKRAAKYNDKLNSRETAAELLGISPSSLANYELGITKAIPADVVVRMADLYGSPELKCLYCKNDCPIGAELQMPTEIENIQSVTVRLLDSADTETMESTMKDLLKIARDGKVTEDEVNRLNQIVDFLGKLNYDIKSLKMLADKVNGGKTDGTR